MFRRLSSFVLIALLTVLIGVKDLALGFCVCEEALFLGHDPCEEKASPSCGDCCQSEESQQTPCDDCVIPIKLEVEDYLWSCDSFATAPPLQLVQENVSPAFAEKPVSSPLLLWANVKPPPPPGCSLSIQQRRLLL